MSPRIVHPSRVFCHPNQQVEGAAPLSVRYFDQTDDGISSGLAQREEWAHVLTDWYSEQWGDGTSLGAMLALKGSLESCTSLARLLRRLLPDGPPLAALRLRHGLPSAAASAGCGSMLSSVSQLFIDMVEDRYEEFVGSATDVNALLAQMPLPAAP
jgi:hypothetical protein